MRRKVYIHYGNKKFDLNRFHFPVNQSFRNKPSGGFWASPIDAEYGWKQWNEDEHFVECSEENSFKFKLRDDAKVFYISSKEDIDRLPLQITSTDGDIIPDFERLMRLGYDAVEFSVSDNQAFVDYRDSVYYLLYGWDCDSILVLNPYVIIPIRD